MSLSQVKRSACLALSSVFGDAAIADIAARRQANESLPLSASDCRGGRSVYVIGCPDYGNLGDQAIAYAERAFLLSLGINPVMLYGPLSRYWGWLGSNVRNDDLICLQGGGNMGTLYEGYENERLAVIDRFRENRIVAFPQTISYGESKYENAYMRHVEKVYNSHLDLHLVARERMSFERMRRLFPKADVLLTPDIVLSLPAFEDVDPAGREGLCLCLRADKERRLSSDASKRFMDAAGGRFGDVVMTDTMHPRDALSPREGEAAVREKVVELSRARLVVTDRIHGMIFCALSGTPCIALDNSNGKVGQEYAWLEGLPYVRFAGNVDEAVEMLHKPAPEPGAFPAERYAPLFDSLRGIIR